MDELSDCRCAGWSTTVGRSSVFERTDVGTASVLFNDRARVLDVDSLVGCAIQLQIRNPVTGIWEPSFRGVIDEPEFTVSPNAYLANVQLNCVDMFAYLGRVQMVLGEISPGVPLMGHPPATDEQAGQIYYEDGSVQLRITKLLQDGRVPPELYIVFTGNVWVWDTLYDVGDSILNAIRDAADAEFPGVANCYIDRKGRFNFHGRYSRFFPEETAAGGAGGGADWDFMRWKGGDGAAIAADAERAQVRSFGFSRPSSLIYNSAIAWPREEPWPVGSESKARPFPENKKDAQVYLDTTSRDLYGYRAMPPMGDLIIKRHSNDGTTGQEQCQLYAEYMVKNYKDAQKTIRNVSFKSLWPHDYRAEATWDLLCRMDISDALNLSIDAGGVSNRDFFVEGLSKTVRVLQPEFDYVEVMPNLTPASRYAENVFGPYPGA